MPDLFSYLKKKVVSIMVVLLIVAVVIPSVMLYFAYRDYCYERNMWRYAMGEAYLDVRDGFGSMAYCIRTNVSALNSIIKRVSRQVEGAADHLAYMNPPNQKLWWRLSSVCGALRTLAQMSFFPNGSGTVRAGPEVLYQYILELNNTITEAHIAIAYTSSDTDYIYNPDGNAFQLNQTKLLEMDTIDTQFLSSVS